MAATDELEQIILTYKTINNLVDKTLKKKYGSSFFTFDFGSYCWISFSSFKYGIIFHLRISR